MNQNQMRQAPRAVAAPQQSQVPPVEHIQQTGLVAAPNQITHQFEFSYTSPIDNEVYEGRFAVKKLSIKDLGRLGVRKTQLNGGFHHVEDQPGAGIDAETDWINTMIAHLELAVVQHPDWFNIELVYDAGLLGELYKKVAEFENAFFRSRRNRDVGSGGGENAGSSESERSGPAGHVEEVGGGEVPPSLEP
jgi:hypothetical protein